MKILTSRIDCPKELDISWLENLSIKNFDPEETSLTVDMSNVMFSTPAGLCMLHEKIKSHNGITNVIPPKNANPYRYLQRIGFFDNLNIANTQDFVSHDASGRFKEMTVISNELLPRSGVVDDLCEEIASVIAPDDPDFQTCILFCMGEMVNNVVQHSHSAGVITAQFYQATNEVEVAIADHGRGIKAGLKDNPKFYSLNCDIEALEIATQPDTSGAFDSSTEPYRIELNSGNGLYYLKKIIEKTFGEFHIFSNSAHYFQDGSISPEIKEITFFEGTLIVFRLNRGYTYKLEEVLGDIRKENLDTQTIANDTTDIQFE